MVTKNNITTNNRIIIVILFLYHLSMPFLTGFVCIAASALTLATWSSCKICGWACNTVWVSLSWYNTITFFKLLLLDRALICKNNSCTPSSSNKRKFLFLALDALLNKAFGGFGCGRLIILLFWPWISWYGVYSNSEKKSFSSSSGLRLISPRYFLPEDEIKNVLSKQVFVDCTD